MIADGYKDTEIGVIPIEWEIVSLGDVLEYEQPTKYLVETTDYDNSYSIPVLTAGKSFILGYTNETSGIYENLPAIIFDDFTTASKYVDFPFKAKSSAMKILKVRNKEYPTNLFYEYLNSVEFEAGTHKRYWISEYQNLKIPLPPLKEQEKIADILSTADDKIEAIATQIKKTEILKKGLLQKLLSEGVGHSEYKDSELGKIPKSWKVVLLPSIALDEKNSIKVGPFGSQIKKEDLVASGYKLYGQENVVENNFYIGDRYLCEKKYKALKSSQIISGDIVITMMGTGGQSKVVPLDIEEGIMDSHLMRIRVNNKKIKNYFLSRLINEAFFIRKQIEKFSQGGIMSGLSKGIISVIKIPLPPIEEQKQIAEILSTADEKLEVLRAKKEKYETLKKGLLQKLLSGEVRV